MTLYLRESLAPSTQAAYTSATLVHPLLSHLSSDSTLLPASKQHIHAVLYVHVPRIYTQAAIYQGLPVCRMELAPRARAARPSHGSPQPSSPTPRHQAHARLTP